MVAADAAPPTSRSLQALRALVEATTGSGQEFLEALVVNLPRSLGVKHALVGELTDDDPTCARVLAACWDGRLGAPFTYLLDGTPCERVLAAGELAYYPSGVADAFPRDEALARKGIQAYLGCPLLSPQGHRLGILVVLHDRPLDEATEPATILRLFAARAAAELGAMRADRLRRQREETVRYALGAARMATFDWDPVRGERRWSPGAAELLGLPPGALDGGVEALLEVVAPEDRPALAECLTSAVEGRRRELDLQYRVRPPGGGERWLHHRGQVDLDAEGRAARISGVVADVTERRLLEASLQHAQKLDAVGRLAGGIAHDFNNLLTVIRSCSELAEEELGANPAALELVRPIREASERAAALTRQLLSFARRQVLSPQVLDPRALVADLARLLHRLLGEQVRLELSLPERAWPVRIDPGQLEQVLVNLAVNARDAMPGGGTLRLSVEDRPWDELAPAARASPPGDQVAFRVSDDGAGMDPATAARAFEPFFTTKGPDRGTGLGLATCHGIVTQAGGAIWLESRPGGGTTVTFTLPRHLGQAAPAPPPVALPSPGGLETLLVVEDEEAVRGVVVRALSALGYRVLVARDGAEALAVAAGHAGRLDLLVTDLVLPGMDGREVARRLLAARPGLRVLYASGYSERPPPSAAGAFLQKPFTPAELGRAVRAALAAPPPPPALVI